MTPSQALAILIFITISTFLYRLFTNPLIHIPGPWVSYLLVPLPIPAPSPTKTPTTRQIHHLHTQHGSPALITRDHISFNTPTALKTIYGPGSRAQRTHFYKIFEPYGRPTMFTLGPREAHAERKRYLARAYARKGVVGGGLAGIVEGKVGELVALFDSLDRDGKAVEICEVLYCFTLDVTSAFIFGAELGTRALRGCERDRGFVEYLGQSRKGKRRFWSATLKAMLGKAKQLFTTSREPSRSQYFRPANPITAWALETFNQYRTDALANKILPSQSNGTPSLISELWTQRALCISQNSTPAGIPADIDLASECADHLMAGIETTRATLIFLIWALSLPSHSSVQRKLREELSSNLSPADLNADGIPLVAAAVDETKLPYLHAVLKETLRLYNPLPQAQPRVFDEDVVVDGWKVPAGTVVSVSPYDLHRNEAAFPRPLEFVPERWIEGMSEMDMKKKHFWPFSSGGRMCTGLHLATAELATVTAALYLHFATRVHASFAEVSPAVNSVLETFWDERFDVSQENTCLIQFERLG